MGIKARLEMPGSSTDAEADVGRIRTVLIGFSEMLAVPKRLGSARVPMCNFRRPGRKTLFGETPNTTRGDAYAPQTYPETVASQCANPKILRGLGHGSDLDMIAKILDALGEPVEDFERIEFVQEVRSEFTIRSFAFEDMVDGDGQRMGDGNNRLLFTASCGDAPVLSAVVTPFLADGAMRRLHQGGTQRTIPFARFAALAFAGAFVLARTDSDPGSKVMLSGKTFHLGAGLGNDDLGHPSVDPWSAIQTVDVIIVFVEQGFKVRVQFRNLNSKESDVGQQLFDNEFVVGAQIAAEGFLQLWDFATQPPLGQLRHCLGSLFPASISASISVAETPVMSVTTL